MTKEGFIRKYFVINFHDNSKELEDEFVKDCAELGIESCNHCEGTGDIYTGETYINCSHCTGTGLTNLTIEEIKSCMKDDF